nr:hypothetical protein [uncultured Undibacterium sp.]
MGFSNSWIAVKTSVTTLQEELGLIETFESDDSGFPIQDADISRSVLPDGWVLLFFGRYDHPFSKPKLVKKLSTVGDVMLCKIEEHVMASMVSLYSSGELNWSIEHEAERGIFDLIVSGSPPDSFHKLWERIKAEQIQEGGEEADVDLVFDLPILLAQEICGFRHDYFKFVWGKPSFCKLVANAAQDASIEKSKKSWWRFW